MRGFLIVTIALAPKTYKKIRSASSGLAVRELGGNTLGIKVGVHACAGNMMNVLCLHALRLQGTSHSAWSGQNQHLTHDEKHGRSTATCVSAVLEQVLWSDSLGGGKVGNVCSPEMQTVAVKMTKRCFE